jgi:hypothetical protein
VADMRAEETRMVTMVTVENMLDWVGLVDWIVLML